ncbi:hypothetical protein EDB86DRAFT_400204 [Lactarius hatsudake]|nr:hypothetical protein EDB86DRAFT_1996153 [Lactarius hatsudake]KAH9001827.1 hypothetical protein EDB86DRAFT_400204 [Lactarius hatsudake]
MSSSVPPTQLPQYQTSALGSGIASLFIQGIGDGLVFAQFSQWFYGSDRRESSLLSAVIVFVTVVGLAQSGLCFASVWSKYVQHFGVIPLPDWEDIVQPIPTLVISVPVQALMIRRCYHLVGKNMFIITPLMLLLVTSTVMSLWTIVSITEFVNTIETTGLIPTLTVQRSWPCKPSTRFWRNLFVETFTVLIIRPFSVLDVALTIILLHYLTRSMKQVYAAHTRKRISRLVNIVWRSALPPTLCAICIAVLFIQYTTAPQSESPSWLPVIQAMIGKLYTLSLLHMVNAQPLQLSEQPTTFASTLTVPAEVMHTRTQDARGGDIARSESIEERGKAKTVNFAA